jgi:hypothetical protein
MIKLEELESRLLGMTDPYGLQSFKTRTQLLELFESCTLDKQGICSTDQDEEFEAQSELSCERESDWQWSGEDSAQDDEDRFKAIDCYGS